MSDLEREFRELDEADAQQHEASDEDLELDEMEEDLMAADEGDETDLSSLIDRKTELEAQLFGSEEAPWEAGNDEIAPLRQLIDSLGGGGGRRPLGMARPRLERLLRSVDNLEPGSSAKGRPDARRKRDATGSRNLVASRRRRLIAEFRASWKEALNHTPVAVAKAPGGNIGAGDGPVTPSKPGGGEAEG